MNPKTRAAFLLGLFLFCVASAFVLDAGDTLDARAEYLAAVKKYLDQCRGLADVLARAPEPADYKRRLDALHEARFQLPAVPREIDPDGVIGFMLRELATHFAAAQVFVAQGSAESCQRAAAQQRKRIGLIERALERAEKLETKP